METIFDKPAFQNLDSEKKALLQELLVAGVGKTPMELMDLMMKYGDKLSGGKPLLALEKQALIAAIQESAPQNERKRLDEVITMLHMMGKI